MAEETDVNLEELDNELEKENKVEKRIKDLSEKVKLTSEERDELKTLSEEKDTTISNLEKERDFLNSFGDQLAKYPAASEFKDVIKDKVLKGYSVEDATVATLNAEGRLSTEAKPGQEPPANPAGGAAAITPPPVEGNKKLEDMTTEEKRAKLLEAEERGDLTIS